MSPEKHSNLMVGSLIAGAMSVRGSSGVEVRLILDIEVDSLESIALVAL